MSSGGGRTTTTNNDPPAWAVPYFTQGLNLASQVAGQPYTPYTGQQVAAWTPQQQQAMGMVQQQAGSGAVGGATNFATGMLGGQGQYQAQMNPYTGQTTQVGTNPYAGPNQHLESMIGAANRDITTAFNESTMPSMLGQFNAGGAFGGTAMADSMARAQSNLAQQLSDTSNQFRFQDYQTQQQLAENALNRSVQAQQTDFARNAQLMDSYLGRDQGAWGDFQGRQMQALGLMPGLNEAGFYGANQLYQMGQQGQLTNQAGLDADYDEFMRQQNWSSDRLSSLAQMLGTIQGGSTTGPNPNYRSATQNALAAAAVVASLWSDKDAKTDKQPMDPEKALDAVRSMPIETWRYHGDTEQHAGTYSQDFYRALGMAPKEQINSIDMFGALGGAVQALADKVDGKSTNKRKA